MKKSELKKLIREVIESIKSLRENYEPTVDDKAEQDAEARADYNQLTQPVREDEEGEPDPEMLAQFQKWSAAKGGMPHNKSHEDNDTGYELNDPKHPSYSDRMADRADRARDDAKYDGLEEGNGGQAVINGKEVDLSSIEMDGVDTKDYPDFSDAYAVAASFTDGTPLTDQELEVLSQEHGEIINTLAHDSLHESLKNLIKNVLKETDAFSGMKKAKDKEENTQMKADSEKAITSTTEPKEKEESKKLPVVKKPAAPKVVKESLIVKMIRESMEEMARTKGALGRNNVNRTAPLKATGLNYQKKGTPGMGRPAKAGAPVADAEGSGYSFTYIDPEGRSHELDSDLPWYSPNQLNSYLESEVMANTGDLDAKLDPMVQQVLTTIQKTPEKIPSHTFTLKYDRMDKKVKIKAERE